MNKKKIEKKKVRAGERAPWLGVLAAPAEDPGLVPSITWWLTMDSSSRGSDGLLASVSTFVYTHTHTCMQAKYSYT